MFLIALNRYGRLKKYPQKFIKNALFWKYYLIKEIINKLIKEVINKISKKM